MASPWMKLGITKAALGTFGGNRGDLWGFHGSRLTPLSPSRMMPLSPQTSRRRVTEKSEGAQASEGRLRARQRQGNGDTDTIRPASSETGGSAETPLVQRLERPPGSHEGVGVRTAEGPHHGDLSGRQVPTVEWEAGSGSAPEVRGQVVRTGSPADGQVERSGAPVPPGAEADSGSRRRKTIPGRDPEATLVHGKLSSEANAVGHWHRVVTVDSEPREVEFEQSDEATRGFVPFSGEFDPHPLLVVRSGFSRP